MLLKTDEATAEDEVPVSGMVPQRRTHSLMANLLAA